MFSKITPASLCMCQPSAISQKYESKLFKERPLRMIDTQMKAAEAVIKDVMMRGGGGGGDDGDKMAHNRDIVATRVHSLNAKNCKQDQLEQPKRQEEEVGVDDGKRQDTPPDINCNMKTHDKVDDSRPQQQPQFNRVMTVTNGKRTPKSLDIRKEEVMAIRNRFPTKVPIIVQRFCKETVLPQLDKSKYLVPQEITMSQFLTIIRNRMRISSTQTLYLLVNNRSMISLSLTLAEAYNEYAGSDGFLYVTYASQEVFGGMPNRGEAERLREVISEINVTKGDDEHNVGFASRGIAAKAALLMMNANESHFDGFLDNTYKSMCFG